MNSRLQQLNAQFQHQATAQANPTTDVWAHINGDQFLRPEFINKRIATREMMTKLQPELVEYVNKAEFPFYVKGLIQKLGINGLLIKDFGGAGMNHVEGGAIAFELAKIDASVATFYLVHNGIGTAVIDALGDEEQRKRLLTQSINMDKICCFGLTEPLNGSDASGLKTSATRTKGGYLLNGEKRWIGNATFADYICLWARNPEENNNIQCFIVEKGTPGLKCEKIENKYSLRIVQNAHITMKDVFVPDNNKLTHAKDFGTGTNKILESSRLFVAWMIAGLATGAYEAALKYALERKQFGVQIAKYQLNQEKLSRMLAQCEMMVSHLILLSQKMTAEKATMGDVGRAKGMISRMAREVVGLAREVCGGNGILIENHVMKQFLDLEGMYTYEGTYDINMLVSGREITGGLSAFKAK